MVSAPSRMSDSSLSYGAFGIGAVYQTAANQRTGCKKQKPPKPYRASKLRVSNSAMRSRAILKKPQKHVFLRDTRTLSSFLIIATLAPTTLLLHSLTPLLGSQRAQLLKIRGSCRCFKISFHSLMMKEKMLAELLKKMDCTERIHFLVLKNPPIYFEFIKSIFSEI